MTAGGMAAVSLVSGWIPVVAPLLAILAIVAGVDWRTDTGRRSFAGALPVAALLAAALWWVQVRFTVLPYDVAASTYLWIGVLLLAIGTPVAGVIIRRERRDPEPPGSDVPRVRRRVVEQWIARHRLPADVVDRPRRRGAARWARLVMSGVAVPLAVVAALVAVNAQYGYYPTVASLQGDSALPSQSLATFDRIRHHHHHDGVSAHPDGGGSTGAGPSPTAASTAASTASSTAPGRPGSRTSGAPLPAGSLIQVDIPGTTSRFHARTAWVWAPPLVVDGSVDHPPVVMLLAGSPGQTSDWLRGGNAATTAQAYADRHHGVAPLLVLPDANGSVTGDTECVDSSRGRAETYLAQDVPAYLSATFGAASSRWAVAGLSEGGTCAAMLALRHPDLFSAFADYSGLTSPSLTETIDRTTTARQLFGGDVKAYDEHDPLWLLAHDPPKSVRAVWQVGATDARTRAAQRTLAAEASRAGLKVDAVETLGAGHDFTFWTRAFAETLPVLMDATTPPPPRQVEPHR